MTSPVGILGMLLRRSPVRRLRRVHAKAQSAGLPFTLLDLEVHYLRKGNPEALVDAAMAVRATGQPLRKDLLVEALSLGLDPTILLRDPNGVPVELRPTELLREQAPKDGQAALVLVTRLINKFNSQPRTLSDLKVGFLTRWLAGKDLLQIAFDSRERLALEIHGLLPLVPVEAQASLPALRHDG